MMRAVVFVVLALVCSSLALKNIPVLEDVIENAPEYSIGVGKYDVTGPAAQGMDQ